MLQGMMLWACAPASESHSVEQPKLEVVVPSEAAEVWGADVAPGFLRPCKTAVAGDGLVELMCDEHSLVEFRRPPSAEGQASNAPGLGTLMEILGDRFGSLDKKGGRADVDEQVLQVSDFVSEKNSGVAALVENEQGYFWGLVCYGKTASYNRSFCIDAIASAARSGGLSHVGAKPPESLGDGRLVTPADCQQVPGRKIHCQTGELSWSAGDSEQSAEKLRTETLQRLRDMAKEEHVTFTSTPTACTLFKEPADCLVVRLHNPTQNERLGFVLLVGGGQDRLVVCTSPNELKSSLPEPCDQAIKLSSP